MRKQKSFLWSHLGESFMEDEATLKAVEPLLYTFKPLTKKKQIHSTCWKWMFNWDANVMLSTGNRIYTGSDVVSRVSVTSVLQGRTAVVVVVRRGRGGHVGRWRRWIPLLAPPHPLAPMTHGFSCQQQQQQHDCDVTAPHAHSSASIKQRIAWRHWTHPCVHFHCPLRSPTPTRRPWGGICGSGLEDSTTSCDALSWSSAKEEA